MARQPGTYAIINTSEGTIVCRLFEKDAPKTVANFTELAEGKREWTHPVSRKKSKDRLYDGSIFHRVIPDFMIQGGGFEPDMKQKPAPQTVENEAKNGLKNDKYTLAMARTSDPHSASAQFFINTKNNSFLDYPGQDGWGYAVFGKVTEGADVVDQINKVKTGRSGMFADVPNDPVIIEKVEVL
jgi:peptidyl-prolyl cis-trans isomerase B (cyclophilin B)